MAKRRKVEEPLTPYTATPKSPAKAGAPAVRKTEVEGVIFQRALDKIFNERKQLLRKLAQ